MTYRQAAPRRTSCVAALLGALLSACTGQLGEPPSSTEGSSGAAGGSSSATGQADAPFAPAAGGFKRLTATQFQNSLTDLLGNVTVGDLEPDMWASGFAAVGASAVTTSPRGVEQYQAAIDTATQQLFADKARRDALIGCAPSASDTTCARSFITTFGRRAWRAPLTAAQIDRYTTLAAQLTDTLTDPIEGLRQTMNALLQSPYFIYRVERGEPTTGVAWWKYTGYEMAARLSYFLTNSMPDAELSSAAAGGDLDTADGVRTQATRLLASTRGRASIGNFADELFQVAIIGARAKDPTIFSAYTPALQSAMAREASSMLEALVFDRGADAMEMFTTRSTYANKELADLYGVPSTGMTSTTWSAITLPASGPRAGLLGTAGYLSLYASQKEGSPTTRGKFIRQLLMCQAIPDPPSDVSTNLPDPPAGTVLTKREKLLNHRTVESCAGCHSLMDPLGLPLEGFDAIGAIRDNDHGKALDLSGDIDGVAFDGPLGLGTTLAKSPATARCLAKNIYRYASGHAEAAGEEKVINELVSGFEASQHDLRELMLQVVTSDGFRYVAPPAP